MGLLWKARELFGFVPGGSQSVPDDDRQNFMNVFITGQRWISESEPDWNQNPPIRHGQPQLVEAHLPSTVAHLQWTGANLSSVVSRQFTFPNLLHPYGHETMLCLVDRAFGD